MDVINMVKSRRKPIKYLFTHGFFSSVNIANNITQ